MTRRDDMLSREARAALPLARQLLLYLDPFALFMDASRGPLGMRQHALSYNRAMRWMLVPYLRRWVCIAALFFASTAPAEALAAQVIVPAALAVGFCIAATVAFLIAAAYLLLGMSRGN